ncbi:lysylphosphatidylglycerol synthase transmembrane domain-containing protein [Chloroflexus sp.]|uniref:lysylphosphatidylglycerol synthase transmembrane domain-containing protein n=1 Tax=Chloroflexus sp. TaxID=1904827 RepID=UPI002ACED1AA|nr:lysylphosphatidylglycerol synthase transmembrane domain-containing protein [Chloroflexus sp.]
MGVKRWKLITSAIISIGIITLAILNRHWIAEAFSLLNDAKPGWLLAALALIALSYLMSAQVFNVVLRSLGYRMSLLRLWATALTAIIISQSVPVGGVGSYAFLMSNFNRRGIRAGESALLASLETLSYVVAMLLVFSFSLAYFAWHGLRAASASYIAGLVGLSVIGLAIFVLTRTEATLRRWLGSIHCTINRLLNHQSSGAWTDRIVADLARGRSLLIHRQRDVMLLVLIQLTALSGHSLAMLLVLHALGTDVSFAVVLAAFGIALVTSTFNVLPGGGGTVEAALVAVLSQMGAGPAAVPAAIIFRLFNYWLAAPVAAVCYHWLMHEHVTPLVSSKLRTRPIEAPSHD